MENNWPILWQMSLDAIRMADTELYSTMYPSFKRLFDEKWSSSAGNLPFEHTNEIDVALIGTQLPILLSDIEQIYTQRVQYIREYLVECWNMKDRLHLDANQTRTVILQICQKVRNRTSLAHDTSINNHDNNTATHNSTGNNNPNNNTVDESSENTFLHPNVTASLISSQTTSPVPLISSPSTYYASLEINQEEFSNRILHCLQLSDSLRFYCMVNVLLVLCLLRLYAQQYHNSLAGTIANTYELLFAHSFPEASTIIPIRQEIANYLYQIPDAVAREYCDICHTPLFSPVLLHQTHICCWSCVLAAIRASPDTPTCPQCNYTLRILLDDIAFIGFDNQTNSLINTISTPSMQSSTFKKTFTSSEMRSKSEMELFNMLSYKPTDLHKRVREFSDTPEQMQFDRPEMHISTSMDQPSTFPHSSRILTKRRKTKPGEVLSAPLSLVTSPVTEEHRLRSVYSQGASPVNLERTSNISAVAAKEPSMIKSEELAIQQRNAHNKSPSTFMQHPSQMFASNTIPLTEPPTRRTSSLSSEGESSVMSTTTAISTNDSNKSPSSTSSVRVSCHQCKTAKEPSNLLYCHMVTGRKSKCCQKKYCEGCLRRSYTVDLNSVDDEEKKTWICFSCRGRCNCASCSRKQIDLEIQQGLKEGRLKRVPQTVPLDPASLALVATPAVIFSSLPTPQPPPPLQTTVPSTTTTQELNIHRGYVQSYPSGPSTQILATMNPMSRFSMNPVETNTGVYPQMFETSGVENLTAATTTTQNLPYSERWNSMPMSAFERVYPTSSIVTLPNYSHIQVSTSPSFATHRLSQNMNYLTENPALQSTQGATTVISTNTMYAPQSTNYNAPSAFIMTSSDLNDQYQRYIHR
jgi:hypothetical protein